VSSWTVRVKCPKCGLLLAIGGKMSDPEPVSIGWTCPRCEHSMSSTLTVAVDA